MAPLTAEIYSIISEMGAWLCLSRKELSYQPQPVWPKELSALGESPPSNTGCYPKIFVHLMQHFLQPSCMTRSGWKPCIVSRRTWQGFSWSFYFIPKRTGLCDIYIPLDIPAEETEYYMTYKYLCLQETTFFQKI